MICPNCHREMGDELTCSVCGFSFRMPKPVEDKPADEAAEIINTVEEVTPEEPIQENTVVDIAAEHSQEYNYAPEPEALKRSPVKATHVKASIPVQDEDYISIGGYIGMLVVAFIPLVSLIMCIIWASMSNAKPSRARFAVAILILKAISLLFVLGGIAAYFLITARWLFYVF